MFATSSEMAQHQHETQKHFSNYSDVSGINELKDLNTSRYTLRTNEYSWAEQVFHAGDVVALVAVYKNLPYNLKSDVDQLISEEYRKKLFRVPLFEASLLLLSSDCLPNLQSLSECSKRLYSDSGIECQQQKALDFISTRNPEDIVVLVIRSGQLVATMTLFPFSRKQDIPSLSYLRMDPSFDKLPDVPGLEVGRLAKKTPKGSHDYSQSSDLINTMGMAAAFIVAKEFALKRGLLPAADSYICGDTYGSFISSLKRFFPLTTTNSTINPMMLEDEGKIHGMGMYFIQRQVLGSFSSTYDLISVIENIEHSYPEVANRIKQLLDSDLKTNGIQSIQKFDPEKFRVQFFHFPYHHPKTIRGFEKLNKMILRLAVFGKNAQNLRDHAS